MRRVYGALLVAMHVPGPDKLEALRAAMTPQLSNRICND